MCDIVTPRLVYIFIARVSRQYAFIDMDAGESIQRSQK